MQEKTSGQLELFSQGNSSNQANSYSSKAFISYISGYEKIILIIIGFVITGIIAFSIGVEKGKSSVMLKNDSQLDIAAKQEPAIPAVTPKQVAQEPVKTPQNKDLLNEYIQNYTIQVASFLNRLNAQKEADLLKRKGLTPVVVAKGKFSIVCVGSFSKREEAESLLSRLKKQYTDCRVRRL
jgi:septal ring-binding cell division protein DamX